MAEARTLYKDYPGSVDLVTSFLAMVVDKVERVNAFYLATGEVTSDDALPASDEVKAQYRNPLRCGGIYYKNYGVPLAALRQCTLDDSSDYEREVCGKKVSYCPGRNGAIHKMFSCSSRSSF